MNLDGTWLLVSLIPSGAGMGLFAYGKKTGRMPQLIAGLVLMVYPYFTESLVALVAVGVLVGAALWAAIRMGW